MPQTSKERAVPATGPPSAAFKLHLQFFVAEGSSGASAGQARTHWLLGSGDGIPSHVRMEDAGWWNAWEARYRGSHIITTTLITASPTALLHGTWTRLYDHQSVKPCLFSGSPNPHVPLLELLSAGRPPLHHVPTQYDGICPSPAKTRHSFEDNTESAFVLVLLGALVEQGPHTLPASMCIGNERL
jgi:hypothetical protein